MSRITATYAFDGTGYIEGCHVRVIEQENIFGTTVREVILETKDESVAAAVQRQNQSATESAKG